MTPEVAKAVERALAQHNDSPAADAWEVLCLATLRMAAATAAFDDARRRYVAARQAAA